MTNERHAALPAVVAGIAVLEPINAAQSKTAIVIAYQTQRTDGYGIVQEEHAFLLAGEARRFDAAFARLEAIQPQPDAAGNEDERQQLHDVHGESIRDDPKQTSAIADYANALNPFLGDNSYSFFIHPAMKSALRLIRDLNPFGQPQAARKAAEVRDLINTVSGLSSSEVVRELTTQVLPEIVRQPNLHMRFKLLEVALEEADKALPVLERHIDHSPLPLAISAASSALAADNLMKALANAYADIARSIVHGNQHKAFGRIFQRVTLRAMGLLARRQQLAYRTYAKPSSSSWTLLHELYQMARRLRERVPQEDIASIEQRYLSALLFAYIEPSKLARIDLATAIFCTEQLATHARVVELGADPRQRPSAAACFLVRADEGNPGLALMRLPAHQPIFDGFLIDCSDVLAVLETTAEHAHEHTDEPGLHIPPGLLPTLQIALGGRSTRRFTRKRFKPHADLVGGLQQIIPFLDGCQQHRRAADAMHRQSNRIFSPSEWSLIDQSPDGFLVRFFQGETWKSGVGDIVALQPRESSKVHICLVRRMATNVHGRLELGLQALAPEVSVLDLPGQSEHSRGLFLHRLPAYGGTPGIIAHPGHLCSGQKLKLAVGGETCLWQIGRRLEASDGLEFFALVPL